MGGVKITSPVEDVDRREMLSSKPAGDWGTWTLPLGERGPADPEFEYMSVSEYGGGGTSSTGGGRVLLRELAPLLEFIAETWTETNAVVLLGWLLLSVVCYPRRICAQRDWLSCCVEFVPFVGPHGK